MHYEMKFVETTDTAGLTERVNAELRDGWEYVGVQVTAVPTPPKQQAGVALPASYATVMLATLRREVRPDPKEVFRGFKEANEAMPAPAFDTRRV